MSDLDKINSIFNAKIDSIKSKDELIFEHKFNLKGKRVLISFESSSLGDTIAWIPYVEEFRLKHDCEVICSTFWNNLYQNSYPKIKFIKPGKIVENMYASYKLGCFNPPDDQKWHPSDWRKGPLQKVASDILGLEYKEIRTKINIPNDSKTIKVNNKNTIPLLINFFILKLEINKFIFLSAMS